MIKVALVGIGSMGNVHYASYKSVKNAQIVAVCDIRYDYAVDKVNDESIKIYDSFDKLLENGEFDMVDLCTPSHLHAEMAIKALNAGKHVLSEKPMALSEEDSAAIIDAVNSSGKLYMAAHVVRFMSPYIYLKGIIDSHELGSIVRLETKRFCSIPCRSHDNWMQDLTKSCGTPFDLAIHDLDFIQYALGMPKDVHSVYKKLNGENDYLTAVLLYDGFSATVSSGWYKCGIPFCAEFLAIFENGWLELREGKMFKNGVETEIPRGEIIEDPEFNASGLDGYAAELAYFISCIEQNKKPSIITPEGARDSVSLAASVISKSPIV